jgi:hypothetical protein
MRQLLSLWSDVLLRQDAPKSVIGRRDCPQFFGSRRLRAGGAMALHTRPVQDAGIQSWRRVCQRLAMCPAARPSASEELSRSARGTMELLAARFLNQRSLWREPTTSILTSPRRATLRERGNPRQEPTLRVIAHSMRLIVGGAEHARKASAPPVHPQPWTGADRTADYCPTTE